MFKFIPTAASKSCPDSIRPLKNLALSRPLPLLLAAETFLPAKGGVPAARVAVEGWGHLLS